MDNELAIAILVVLAVGACATMTYIAKEAFCTDRAQTEEYTSVAEV
jgi:hypothetical protein